MHSYALQLSGSAGSPASSRNRSQQEILDIHQQIPARETAGSHWDSYKSPGCQSVEQGYFLTDVNLVALEGQRYFPGVSLDKTIGVSQKYFGNISPENGLKECLRKCAPFFLICNSVTRRLFATSASHIFWEMFCSGCGGDSSECQARSSGPDDTQKQWVPLER